MKFLVTLLAFVSVSSFASRETKTCGTQGTVRSRMADCSAHPRARVNGFDLVSRITISENGTVLFMKEIHRDRRTGLLWSDSLAEVVPFKKALSICGSNQDVFFNISSGNWRLPSMNDYGIALDSGILQAKQRVSQSAFWSSSAYDREISKAWQFNGGSRLPLISSISSYASVMCILDLY